MHWRNEKEWVLWNDRIINGVKYTFTHLRSFDMDVVKEARGELAEFKATVRVVFDCHVVTEKVHFATDDAKFWKDTGGKDRKFDQTRYKYSLRLPELISALTTGKVKCYAGKRSGKLSNYMVWESADMPCGAHYQAFFDIYKPSNQPPSEVPLLILYVQSAYLKDEPFAKQRERFKAFGQICAELAGSITPKAKGPRSSNKHGKQR
jgi:hypothetical protein